MLANHPRDNASGIAGENRISEIILGIGGGSAEIIRVTTRIRRMTLNNYVVGLITVYF